MTLPVSPPGTEAAATPDATLLQEAVAGDSGALAELYDRYETKVFNYCLRLTGSVEDAADATQEAFLNVLRRLRHDDAPVRDFAAYLFTTARHESYRMSRRRARSYPFGEPPEPAPESAWPVDLNADPERSALVKSTQQEIRAANGRLPPRYREVLALRDLEGASYEQIGEIMGMSGNAVAQLIWRARVRLRRELREAAVASVVAATHACERAQSLICMREDGELHDPDDRKWLERHLDECGSCRASRAALLEVGSTYNSWLPVVAVAGMRDDFLAHGGELIGASVGAAGSAANGAGHAVSNGVGHAAPHSALGAAGAIAVGLASIAILSIAGGGGEKEPAARAATDDDTRTPAAAAPSPPRSERSAAAPAPAAKRPGEGSKQPRGETRGGREGGARDDGTRAGKPDAPSSGPRVAPRKPRAPGRPPASPPDRAPARPRPPDGGSPPGAVKPQSPVQSPSPPAPVDPPQEQGCTHPGQGAGPPGCPPGHGGQPPGQVKPDDDDDDGDDD